ncbi:M20 family metallopeptidase [Martelella endophytica]|uniref:Hippurate hydrolase n=1 Tax=Martelella endophytica TaxID=1486262 RepID=A0A0D5LLI6_MAREN|nr:M20 family metallopeptidase [Martelella endophytica]AJY45054.1 hippurate hydrolase [Martelella endophytica]
MTPVFTADDIDLDAFLAELEQWVAIESPSSDIAAVNRMMEKAEAFAQALGLAIERTPGAPDAGDMLTVRTPRAAGDNRPGILILAHLDTVHAVGTIADKLPLRRDGYRLYGPGIYDMKAGVLMALQAMALAAKAGDHLPTELLIVPDEEIGSKSSRPLIEERARDAACTLVVEPARDGGKIVTARKGVGMFDIVVRGRAAHAGVRPLDGRSAIRAAARLVLDLEALNDPARGISVTTGTIQGGTGRNTVPEECRLQLDLRLPDATSAAEVIAKVKAMKPVDPDITFEITGDLNRPPFAQSDAGRRLFDQTACIASELGFTLEGMATGGGSDGNFTAALGVPTLDGLGADGAGAHTFEEHILVSSIAPRTALLANILALVEMN